MHLQRVAKRVRTPRLNSPARLLAHLRMMWNLHMHNKLVRLRGTEGEEKCELYTGGMPLATWKCAAMCMYSYSYYKLAGRSCHTSDCWKAKRIGLCFFAFPREFCIRHVQQLCFGRAIRRAVDRFGFGECSLRTSSDEFGVCNWGIIFNWNFDVGMKMFHDWRVIALHYYSWSWDDFLWMTYIIFCLFYLQKEEIRARSVP